jgi:hypothetical protein
MRFQHPSYFGRPHHPAATVADRPATPEPPAAHWYSQRACCCPAPPIVIAMIPANDRHGPAELLLCGHHYRQSRQALAATSATLTDLKGHPLTSETWPEPAC